MKILKENSTIEFRNVNFSYIPGKPIFNNLSLTIPAGKKIAIVGGSGSGYVYVLYQCVGTQQKCVCRVLKFEFSQRQSNS